MNTTLGLRRYLTHCIRLVFLPGSLCSLRTHDMPPQTQCTTLLPEVLKTEVGAEHWQVGADMMPCASALFEFIASRPTAPAVANAAMLASQAAGIGNFMLTPCCPLSGGVDDGRFRASSQPAVEPAQANRP
jgi:hypothetical protein